MRYPLLLAISKTLIASSLSNPSFFTICKIVSAVDQFGILDGAGGEPMRLLWPQEVEAAGAAQPVTQK